MGQNTDIVGITFWHFFGNSLAIYFFKADKYFSHRKGVNHHFWQEK